MANKASLQQIPERLDIRVDWAFHHFFRKKKHLVKIIKDLLDLDIEVIEYLPNLLDTAVEKDKRSVFDVACRNAKTGETFVLEMQRTDESDMMDRLYYYGGSLIHNQVEKGNLKYVVNSVLVCCIATYDVRHNDRVPAAKVFFRYRMMENDTHEVFDGDKLNICFLELKRFGNYLKPDSDLREQWCWIFNNLANFVERPKNLDSSFDDVIRDAETRKLSEKQKKDYMKALELNERDRLVIYEGGYNRGMVDGMEKGKNEIAKNLLDMGMQPSDVAKATGLTKEAVSALK